VGIGNFFHTLLRPFHVFECCWDSILIHEFVSFGLWLNFHKIFTYLLAYFISIVFLSSFGVVFPSFFNCLCIVSHSLWAPTTQTCGFVGLAYYQGKKDIVFRFIIEYSSLRDFYRPLGNNNNRSIFIGAWLKDDILACVETWD
jgi:hypothetical protein